ncbi:hypothetical protein OSTOST_20513, partial [Ostertagia ostertagi]
MLIKSEYPPVALPTAPFHETLLNAIKGHMESEKKTAFVSAETSREVTFKDIYDLSHSVASFLHKKNFRRDVACMVMPNHWVWAPFFLGVTMNGGTLTGFNPAATEYELKRQFVDSRAKVALTNKASLMKVLTASRESPYMKDIICYQDEPCGHLPAGVHCWNEHVAKTPAEAIPKPHIDIAKDI